MDKLLFLHDHPEFLALLQVLSTKLNIRPQLIEKDYWLMHCLSSLHKGGLKFELKGGTSLSKGWGIINRFSEDVDIKIFPPEELEVYSGKNQTKPFHLESRAKFYEWLKSNLSIPGAKYIERDFAFDDKELRNAGFRIGYDSKFELLAGLKTDVLLEVGFDVTTPNEPKDIYSWAYDFAIDNKLQIIDNVARAVPCYLPEYTLVEKLSAISKKYRQEIEGRNIQNFTRHYYDVYQLLGEARIQTFLGSKEYVAHKIKRFTKNDELEIRKNSAFSIPDKEIRKRFKERLIGSSGLYFKGQPDFDEIIERIMSFSDRL
jgi:predicted nucleotidyltransferase component of viral defense system